MKGAQFMLILELAGRYSGSVFSIFSLNLAEVAKINSNLRVLPLAYPKTVFQLARDKVNVIIQFFVARETFGVTQFGIPRSRHPLVKLRIDYQEAYSSLGSKSQTLLKGAIYVN
ncbi:hypothetical protein HY407_03970 [Candidatus Gottesmanbacteria bacterium]|nr:hypothetical protein [Candidatus Gottesmanbacteria bacterium]